MNLPSDKYITVYNSLETRLNRIMESKKPFLCDPRDLKKGNDDINKDRDRDRERDKDNMEWVNTVYSDLCRHHSIMNLLTPYVVRMWFA